MRKFLNDSLYRIFTYSDKLMSYCLVMKWESGGLKRQLSVMTYILEHLK